MRTVANESEERKEKLLETAHYSQRMPPNQHLGKSLKRKMPARVKTNASANECTKTPLQIQFCTKIAF